MSDETRVPIRADYDIVTAREKGRFLASHLGLSSTESTLVVTAISELARNILRYARRGEIILHFVQNGDARGISVEARDEGPGIADVTLALTEGYTTGTGLGLGLSGSRRLVDEFDLRTDVGAGTHVTIIKWGR